MKFSISISNQSLLYSDYPDDVQGILEQFHLLFVLYSNSHILSPKSVAPNIFCATPHIPVEDDGKCNLLTSLPKGLYSSMMDILRACGRDPYLQPLLRCEHFHCYKSESVNHDGVSEYLRTRPDNDTSFPKLCDTQIAYSMRSMIIFHHTAKVDNLYKLK